MAFHFVFPSWLWALLDSHANYILCTELGNSSEIKWPKNGKGHGTSSVQTCMEFHFCTLAWGRHLFSGNIYHIYGLWATCVWDPKTKVRALTSMQSSEM